MIILSGDATLVRFHTASVGRRRFDNLVARGYEPRYAIGLEVLKSLPYNRWREADPEDTIRFHALRLHEVGMIKNTPQKLIAQGTDWRFLNEIKKELKA
jgi:NitT/TauT family transport system substrate-binding protein